MNYPKPRVLNVTKDSRWFKSTKEKSTFEKAIWEKGKLGKDENGEFIMKQRMPKKNDITQSIKSNNINMKSLLRQSVGVPFITQDDEDEQNEENKEELKELDSDEEDMKYEKETGKVEEVSKEKMPLYKDDKNLTKHIISLMVKNKKTELRFPELPENNELVPDCFNHIELSGDKKNPIQILLDLSNIISFKLFQAAVNQNTESDKICAIIAIDCCRTINKMRKFYHAILAFGIINCFNAMEIPYSVVLFADYQFLFTIKKFEIEHNDSIYKTILDCIMVPRYSSRIADVCYYMDKKVIHPTRNNKGIFIISNGLDPKLKTPEQWSQFLGSENNKYCFYFIKPEMERQNEEIILNIWDNFKKGTGNEVVVIENLDDILNGAEEIFTKFGYVLSETAILTEEEKSKFSKNLNNIEGKFL